MYDDYKIMGQKQFEKVAKKYSEKLENVAILGCDRQKKSTTTGVMLLHVLNCI